jgi:hypothetical protein
MVILPAEAVSAADGEVLWHQKISDTAGGFNGTLDDDDEFGRSVASLGDFDGDGVGDLAVGAWFDDDGGGNRGAVWILLLSPDGTVKSLQKISSTEGGFGGALGDADHFGSSVASLGDFDGDGVGDLAVGAAGANGGGVERGVVWMVFLNDDGTVKSQQEISDIQGGFTGELNDFDEFGWSVASLGDLDGDEVGDLAVGALWDDDGGDNHGAVWVLFLNPDGTVKSHQKISDTEGNFSGGLNDNDWFGSVDSLGDLNGDGIVDLAVGAWHDDDGGVPPNANRGAVWILFLNTDGTVKSHQKISSIEGEFTGPLDDSDEFGSSVALLGDLNSDGVSDLAVGAYRDGDGGTDNGAVWVLFLNTDGTVKSHQKISDTEGNFSGGLNGGHLGISAVSLGDIDDDGVSDLAVGAYRDDDGGNARGAVWVLFLDGAIVFNPPVTVGDIGEPTAVASDDFTASNGNDIAVTELGDTPQDPGNVVLLLNDGSGVGFTPLATPVGREPSGIAVADFDGIDGPDAAVSNAADNNLTVLLNRGDGDGGFNTLPSVPVGANPSAVVAGDFNGDTVVDLAVANRDDNTVTILTNNGGGVFAQHQVIPVGSGPSALAVGYFDLDLSLDLAVANEADNTVMILINDGAGTFVVVDTIFVGLAPGALDPEDLDDDTVTDLVIANRGSANAVILRWYGPGFYGLLFIPVGADPSSVESSDLDGDGDQDVLVVAGLDEERAVRVLRNNLNDGEELSFTIVADLAPDPNLRLTAAEDLDGNALPDIIAVNGPSAGGAAAKVGPQDGSVEVLLNTGGIESPCPWDCAVPFDDEVSVVEVLALLAQWGQVGASCDVDGGGVGITDFLAMLANWGPCPSILVGGPIWVDLTSPSRQNGA